MEDRTTRDRELVEAVLLGHSDAFGELVTAYQRLVASVAWRYGTPRQEIEDLVSEIFIKAYGNLQRYRPENPFSTWLYRLAANHVVDHGRRKRKERGRVEMPEQIIDDAPSASATAESLERAQLLRQALGELPSHYREVLFLVYIEGFKIDDAARNLGLPQGTIKTRLMRGRQALRRILERRNPGHFGE